jgi:biotin transport system substrate-specific component
MDKVLQNIRENAVSVHLILVLLGCCCITLGSLVKIPFYPVPFTLQTLAISMLALTQSPSVACSSCICYLICGSLGLPVFNGHSNPCWFMGKCAGYLLAFPLAAYLSSLLAKKWNPWVALLCGQLVIYLFGFLVLSAYFGISIAFTRGIVFFIPSDLLKIMLAILCVKTSNKWRKHHDRLC